MLLATVIGKHSIFAQFAVTAPIAAVLRSLEATIDVSPIESQCAPYSNTVLYQSFAFAMIDLIPTQTPAVHTDQNTLDDAVGNTISTYNQFCTPSPFYPRQLPTCV